MAGTATNTMRFATLANIREGVMIMPAILATQFNLPFADSLIYASTLIHQATLWTQDQDFKDLPHVNFFPKLKS